MVAPRFPHSKEKAEQNASNSPQERTLTTIAVYPGSFDPLTNGHLDIIERGSGLFDKLIVAIAHNTRKQSLFTVEERLEMIRQVVVDIPNVEVDNFEGLTMTSDKCFFVSSQNVKEVAIHGGDVSQLVPPPVSEMIAKKMGR